MNERVLTPRNRGFLFLDSHPAGCAQLVADMWQACPAPADVPEGDGPVALVVGSSAGYGLAATLAGLKRVGIRGIAVSFEKAPTVRRTATVEAGTGRPPPPTSPAPPDATWSSSTATRSPTR